MNVLLVQINASSERNPLVYPLGLSYVGTALAAKGHGVRILDLNDTRDPLGELAAALRDQRPGVVGLSLKYGSTVPHDCIPQCLAVTGEIRRSGQAGTRIAMGGPGFTLYGEEIMKDLPELDFGVIYEGEETFPELLENLESPGRVRGILYREGGQIRNSGERPRVEFGALPIPRRDFLDITPYLARPYIVGVQTKRGCVIRCNYCAYSSIDGTSLRMRSPAQVADEIEQLVKVHGVRTVAFTDNVFNIPTTHAEGICRELLARKLGVQWTAWLHPKHVTREFVELARDAGCRRFEFSPDAYSDRSLEGLGKKLAKKDIVKTLAVIRDFKDIEVRYNFFFWPPGQSLLGLAEMILFKAKLRLVFGKRLQKSKLGAIVLEPKTRLHQTAIEQGAVRPDTNLFTSCAVYWPAPYAGVLYRAKERLRRAASLGKSLLTGRPRRRSET